MRLRSVLPALFCLAALLWSAAAPAQTGSTGRRIALVVGNSDYRNVARLSNPTNDARLMARTLQSVGFTLVGGGPQVDLSKAQFDRAVQQFGSAVQGADVALFYYSGHGMQVAGTNWLVPIDANPTRTRDLDFQMVDANLVLRQMEGAGTRLNLLLLDACRNNPFAGQGVRATAGGLAEMRAPEGTLISYATQPGNVAADGGGANSPYTAALASAIRQPGVDVFRMFNQVGLTVKAATAGEQQPWLASSPINGTFFFLGPVTITQPPVSDETVFWQSIAASRNPADFQAYLRRYPNGVFAELAQTRMASTAPAPTPVAAMAPESCHVDMFRGMVQPGGTTATMRVLAGSAPCTSRVWTSLDPRTPYDRLDVSVPARSGTVTTEGTGFAYQPRPGFVGQDEFTVTGVGKTPGGRPVTGLVRVTVLVSPR